MAQPAAEVRSPGLREVLRLLAPFPGRTAIAVRVALICTLTVLVTSAYGTPEAALSAYVVFFMIRADRVTSIVLEAALLLIVTIVIGLVLGIAIFSIDYSILRVACMVVMSVGLLYLTSASKLRPVGAILAMIVGFGLDELGLAPFGEAATRALLYIWLTVAIPVGVAIVVNLLIAPSPRKLALAQLAKRLRLAARRLRGDDGARAGFDASLREGDKQLLTWLKLSKLEGSSSAADIIALRQAVASSTALLVAVALADREADARLPDTFAAPIAATLDEMAAILERGGYPVDVTLALPPADALPPLVRIAAADLHAAITRFAEPDAIAGDAPAIDTAKPAASPTPQTAPPAAPRGGFFLPDARTNPDHIRYALKTTAAAMFCYLLYSQLDWSGIHTCFITCYIVSLGSTAETVEKLTLRIAGCIVGALLGTAALVFVVPSLTSIGQLMALVFVGAWLSAWVSFGSPRIAYAGFQIAFAFFLCVIQGAGPGFDLTIARDRTIGILLGNVVVYLVFTRIWPVSIGKQIDVALTALREQWRRLAQIAQPAERRALAAEAFARHGAIAQELGLVHYEPSWVRPTAAWLATRRRALAELGALEGPLFLLAERAPGDAAIDARLARVAELRDDEAMPDAHDARDDETAAPVGMPPSSRPAAQAVPNAPPAPAPRPAAPPDPARDALLNLIDARLAAIANAARQATSKESAAHAPT
ncbi:FUSC family protein [Burkholderia pseudomultivorans]|uniref:Multidrug resistance protein MdtO n=1 Tax=Burkholderia pseudomultivorans TaxID=1207504 RepID=A0ABU2E7H1_9BURK|nr:FUSC family protein [Burkholderia pseudomultivorans]MDR8727055.1 Multidrug resistance protein MdtO [Burkholderia pseudomultivorans]MDR8733105.1 Multidrug resistance protein MdtO [Burkholderia pseudomultivorans]MDR8739972.1 Multidrug resistance protein MdtO [Burkholderia pseudomultivorans]MDR8755807.1 Multidrug resistance protein MdtO [Burkholderia pseudomultivorans]MDR8776078.1 Multidrug resistance protein MdtO [Burkholderia pseudomultivorans]